MSMCNLGIAAHSILAYLPKAVKQPDQTVLWQEVLYILLESTHASGAALSLDQPTAIRLISGDVTEAG